MKRQSTHRICISKISILALCLMHFGLVNTHVYGYDSVKQIPSDLSASQYYAQAVDHVSMGFCEIARECAKRAVQKDPGGSAGNRAKQFLAANCPKNSVPKDAEQQNIAGVNFMAKGKLAAATAILEDTVAEYPQFEWPFYNLACVYLLKGNPSLAQAYASKALKINPQYSNAWSAKANAYILEKKFARAKECAQKAILYDPQNQTAAKMLQFLKRKIR